MGQGLHWLQGSWAGKLALSARPRGGDWLSDEVSAWQVAGIAEVISLLTKAEEESLDVKREGSEVRKRGMQFIPFPIADMDVPNSESELNALLERVNRDLSSGKNVLIHCRQGLGRTGLVASCLLVTNGYDALRAMDTVSAARGVRVPETPEQEAWVRHFATALAGAK